VEATVGFWLRLLSAAILLALSLAACGASTGQEQHTSDSPSSGAAATNEDEGSSFDRAVVFSDAKNEMEGVSAEHKWIESHYAGWSWGTQYLINHDGCAYDLIEISRSSEHRKVYFDISNWFGRL
jgi:hypothetical protein